MLKNAILISDYHEAKVFFNSISSDIVDSSSTMLVTVEKSASDFLSNKGIKYREIYDYSPSDRRLEIDKKAIELASNSWFSFKGNEALLDLLNYRDVFLAPIFEIELTYHFIDVLEKISIYNNFIDSENITNISYVDKTNIDSDILGLICKQKGVEISPRYNSNLNSAKEGIISFKNTMKSYLKNTYRSYINLANKKDINFKNILGSNILFVTAGTRLYQFENLMLELKKTNHNPLFLEKKGYFTNNLDSLSDNEIPYLIYNENYSNRKLRQDLLEFSNSSSRVWANIKNNSNFKAKFVHDSINFWPISKTFFNDLISKKIKKTMVRISFTESVLKSQAIDLVVLMNDFVEFERTLVLVSKKIGKPSLVIQHGVFADWGNDICYAPQYCTTQAVWGEYFRNYLVQKGINRKNLKITGQPRFDILNNYKNTESKTDIFKLINNEESKSLITILTQPFITSGSFYFERDHENWFHEVMKAATYFNNINFVVKVHINENPEKRKEIVKMLNLKNVKIIKEINLYDLINVSDLIISSSSTTVLEAMLLNKPVLSINLNNRPDFLPFAEIGASMGVNKKEGIIPAIKSLLNNKEYSKKLLIKMDSILSDFNFKNDGKSTDRVINLMNQMVKQ